LLSGDTGGSPRPAAVTRFSPPLPLAAAGVAAMLGGHEDGGGEALLLAACRGVGL